MADSDALSQEEIDSLLASLTANLTDTGVSTASESTGLAFDDFGSAVDDQKKSYKLYNFRRPDKFSKDHLRALQTIHDTFARQLGLILTGYLRMHVEVDVVSVDQLTYDEFIRSMPSPITVSIIELEPLSGQILMGIGHEITTGLINRMLGGVGQSEIKPRELTDIEDALVRRIVDKTIKALEESWRSLITVEASLVGMENSYSLIQIATPGEIVALVTFQIELGSRDSGLVSLCLPYPVLEPIIAKLTAQHIFHSKISGDNLEEQGHIIEKLGISDIDLSVSLGKTRIRVIDLLELQIGDVLRLDSQVKDDFIIYIGDIPKFKGRPGTIKNKVAVHITDEIPIRELHKLGKQYE